MAWITLIATIVVAIATVVYVWLTHRLLKETKRSIDETDRPEVVVFLKFEDSWTNHYSYKLSFCVQNIGKRAARKVKFEGNFSFQAVGG